MAVDQSQLNERVAEAVGFLGRVLTRQVEGVEEVEREGYREFRITSAIGARVPLVVDTENGEITVDFGCHDHISAHEDSNEADMVGEMVVKVMGLISGGELAYSAWRDDTCLGGGWLRAGEDPRGKFNLEYFHNANRIVVTGWAGWDDVEIRRGDAFQRE